MHPGSDPPGQTPLSLPEAVRELALHPFRDLPVPKNVERIELDGAAFTLNPFPGAQVAFPRRLDADVGALVEETRRLARGRGKQTIGWWIAPDHDAWVPALEELGIVNADTPGFEAVENALALVTPPVEKAVEGVEVRELETLDDFKASVAVAIECFGFPALSDDEVRARYEEHMADRDVGQSFLAIVEGRVVGTAYAAFGAVGLNLFGAAVVPDARGRGVYRALLQTRWAVAVARGTPALTVQAGRMSLPVCERLGFQLVGRARVFVDTL